MKNKDVLTGNLRNIFVHGKRGHLIRREVIRLLYSKIVNEPPLGLAVDGVFSQKYQNQ